MAKREIEITAKSVDTAIEEGLEKLGATYGDVDVEIISQGGMFKKAKVKLTLKQSAEPTKASKEKEAKPSKNEKTKDDSKNAQKHDNSNKSGGNREKSGLIIEEHDAQSPQKDKDNNTKQAKHNTQRKTNKPREQKEPREPRAQKTPVAKEDYTEKLSACVDFVEKLMVALESTATITVAQDDRNYSINIDGDNVSNIIGKGGASMTALQTIVTSLATKHSNGENADKKRVFVNVEGYNEKRKESLIAIAMKKVEFVKETGKTALFEAMSPRDRAIIHHALSNVEGIKTFSTGEGNDRRLRIKSTTAPKGE